MLEHIHNRIQSQFESISQELALLETRRVFLQHQQTRLNLLHQFQQQGATRPDYIGFQPRGRR